MPANSAREGSALPPLGFLRVCFGGEEWLAILSGGIYLFWSSSNLSHWELSVTLAKISNQLQIASLWVVKELKFGKKADPTLLRRCWGSKSPSQGKILTTLKQVPKFLLHLVGSALHPGVLKQADSRLFSAAARQLQYSCCFMLCFGDVFFITRPWPSGSSNSLLYGNFYKDSYIYLLCS